MASKRTAGSDTDETTTEAVESTGETVDVGPVTVGQPEQVELIEPGTDRRVRVSANRVAGLVNVHGYKRS